MNFSNHEPPMQGLDPALSTGQLIDTHLSVNQDALGVSISTGTNSLPTQDPHFISFLRKVFHSDELSSLGDVRQLIEDNFASSLKPDRDQLSYLKSKLKQMKVTKPKARQPYAMFAPQMRGAVAQTRERAKSNHSMRNEESEGERDEWGNPDDENYKSDEFEDGGGADMMEIDEPPKRHIEERKGQKKPKSNLQRCKEVGRVGPDITKLDRSSAYGTLKYHSDYEFECTSSSGGIRADTAVFGKGRYYYECKILSAGLMQIGWCTLATPFNSERGVGDDETSYAYDGMRIKKWNAQSAEYGEQWATGDIIGTLIDLNLNEISFYRNDKALGIAFKNIKSGPNMAYFPAIYMATKQRVEFNFGQRPFRYRHSAMAFDHSKVINSGKKNIFKINKFFIII